MSDLTRLICNGVSFETKRSVGTGIETRQFKCAGIAFGPDGNGLISALDRERGLETPESVEPPLSSEIYSLRLLLDKAEREVETQLQTGRHIDTKLGVVLGFALIAVVQVLVGLAHISTSPDLKIFKAHPDLSITLALLVSLSFLSAFGAVIFGFWALRPRSKQRPSVLAALDLPELRPRELLRACLSGLDSAIKYNDRVQTSKIDRASGAAVAIAITLILYVLIGGVLLLLIAHSL